MELWPTSKAKERRGLAGLGLASGVGFVSMFIGIKSKSVSADRVPVR